MLEASAVSVLPSGVLPTGISPLGGVPKPNSNKLRLIVNIKGIIMFLFTRIHDGLLVSIGREFIINTIAFPLACLQLLACFQKSSVNLLKTRGIINILPELDDPLFIITGC